MHYKYDELWCLRSSAFMEWIIGDGARHTHLLSPILLSDSSNCISLLFAGLQVLLQVVSHLPPCCFLCPTQSCCQPDICRQLHQSPHKEYLYLFLHIVAQEFCEIMKSKISQFKAQSLQIYSLCISSLCVASLRSRKTSAWSSRNLSSDIAPPSMTARRACCILVEYG